MICTSSRFIIQFRKLHTCGRAFCENYCCLSVSQTSTPWPAFGPKCWAGGSFIRPTRTVLVSLCRDWITVPVSLLCSAVPWRTGCRASLPHSAELCSSPLSQGLPFSHHTVLWSEGMILWSTFTGFFCLQYLFRYVHSPQHLIGFFFRLFLLPTLLYRYRMEIKDICLRAIKGICLKIVMSQIPAEYFSLTLVTHPLVSEWIALPSLSWITGVPYSWKSASTLFCKLEHRKYKIILVKKK